MMESNPRMELQARQIAACEARYVANLPDDMSRANYLGLVEKRRGKDGAQSLRIAAWDLMKGGNCGH